MKIAGSWTEAVEAVIVIGATFGLFRKAECEHKGCHRLAEMGERYCQKHLEEITK